jgi:hypothetical protein
MPEIEQIKQILSEVPQLIQKMICTRLASNFAKSITENTRRMEKYFDSTNLRLERHHELCLAMFRSVLTCNLEEYETDTSEDYFRGQLVVETLDSVPGLKKLRVSQVCDIQNHQVAMSIHHLKKLRVFEYDTYCTDEVVMQLGRNCPGLTEVSFSGSNGVTNDCVPHLLLLRKLKFLDLRGTQIDSIHYALLLSQLPNIADIRFASNQDDVLRHITPDTIDTITHVYDIVNDIYMQIEKFPKTTNFVVNMPTEDLSGITAWTELRNLKITDCNCDVIDLNTILTGIGHNLTELKLQWVTDVNLQDIITLCKSLKILSLIDCLILPLDAGTPLDPQLPHFRNLISLQIQLKSTYLVPGDFNYIQYYLSLERIMLYGFDLFTGEFMTHVVTQGTLANLRECYLSESNVGALTFDVLQELIRHCSHLRAFGCTEYLPHLDLDNILELEHEMLVQNFVFDIKSRFSWLEF